MDDWLAWWPCTETGSVCEVDRDRKGWGDLPHARVGQPSEPLNEDRERDALDRVHIGHAAAGDRVLAALEPDFADEAADRGGARYDECVPVPGNLRRGRGRRPGGARSRPSRTTRPHCAGTVRRLHETTPGHPTRPVRRAGVCRTRYSSTRLRLDGGAPPWRAAPHRSWRRRYSRIAHVERPGEDLRRR
jgi:hypothetical protein